MVAKVWISAFSEELTSLCNWKKWWVEILNAMSKCRAARHVESSFVLYPQTEKGFLTNLPQSWHFMIFQKFFSVMWYDLILNPYRSLRFEICRFGDLPGFCTARPLLRFGTSQKNWWFGTWNLENLWRSWVNFRVDTWHPMALWMNFGWLAHGNHIPYIHENGSAPTGLTAIFNSRVWKLWTTVSEELRSVGQDDICNSYI